MSFVLIHWEGNRHLLLFGLFELFGAGVEKLGDFSFVVSLAFSAWGRSMFQEAVMIPPSHSFDTTSLSCSFL